MKNGGSPWGDGSFEVCCNNGESIDEATPLDDVPECLENIPTEGGPSIALYAMPEVAVTPTNAEVTITSTNAGVTATSAYDCCLTLAAAQPGKIRSAATHICPEKMFTVEGAMHITQDKTNYHVCCDKDALASDIEAGGFPTCEDVSAQTPMKPTNAAMPSQQETNLGDVSDNATQNPGEPTVTAADTPLEQEANPVDGSDNATQTLVDPAPLPQETSLEDGSNSANAMDSGLVCMAIIGALLQAVM